MDVKSSAQQLQGFLIQHDKALSQIKAIDRLMQRQQRLAVRAIALGQKGQALHYMGCKTVIQSVKQFYQQFSLNSWLQVQTLAREIMRAMDPGCALPPVVVPEDISTQCSGDQTIKYQNALVVAHCNFCRNS